MSQERAEKGEGVIFSAFGGILITRRSALLGRRRRPFGDPSEILKESLFKFGVVPGGPFWSMTRNVKDLRPSRLRRFVRRVLRKFALLRSLL
jgi:hypothetical protein